LVNKEVFGGISFQLDFLVQLWQGSRAKLVKDVVVSFQLHTVGDSRLFQQVGLNIGTSDAKDVGEVNTNEFTEARRVVVTRGLGVTIRFQDGICRDDLIFQTWFVRVLHFALLLANAGSDKGKVLNDLLRVLGLTGTRLASNQHGLVLAVSAHGSVGVVGDQVQMRRHFVLLLAAVEVHHLHGVQWQAFEWIDGDAEEA